MVKSNVAELHSSYEFAREILGKDFITPEEIMSARLGIIYSEKQLEKLRETLPSPEIIEWLQEKKFILVAGPPSPKSFLDIYILKEDYFRRGVGRYAECYLEIKHKFIRDDKAELGWIALCKEPLADSFNKNQPEQEALVTDPMVIPNVAETVWSLTTCKAVRGECLSVYARTSSCDSHGTIVFVNFDAEDLGIGYHYLFHRDSNLGILASRKFPA